MRTRSGGLALLLAMSAQAASDVRLEGGPFLPYRMNRAEALSEGGLVGPVELLGRRWDGTQVPLFRTRLEARTQAVALHFYLDEEIRGLHLRAGTGEPVLLDLAREEGQRGLLAPQESSLRERMRRFNPPAHLELAGPPPERFSLGGTDLVSAGIQASYALFKVPILWRPLAPLAAFSLTVVLAAAFGRKAAWALRAVAALAATALVVPLAAPRPMLYRVLFPAVGPESRVAGVVENRIEERAGYRELLYAAGQSEGSAPTAVGATELVGLWAPGGIPAGDLVPPGALVRFSSPPLATSRQGEVELSSQDFVTGWVIHDRP